MTSIRALALAVAVLAAACAKQEEPPAVETPSTNRAASEARVRELEQQARAIVRTDGCDQASECATAPVGTKACGGPRTYLVYCRATTDEAALMRALDALKGAEEAYNREAGIVSDCMLVTPPAVRLEGSSCTAAAP
jgi:cell division protein FtsB